MSWPSRNRRPISCQIFILRLLKRSLPKSFIESPWQEIDVEDLDGLHGIPNIYEYVCI